MKSNAKMANWDHLGGYFLYRSIFLILYGEKLIAYKSIFDNPSTPVGLATASNLITIFKDNIHEIQYSEGHIMMDISR